MHMGPPSMEQYIACIILYVANCLYGKYDDEKVWVLLRYMFVVCIDWYIQKREEKFRWMEMGIVVKIHVPIQRVTIYIYTWHIPLALNLPLPLPLPSPLFPLLLTWNPPSCERNHPPRSQVACKLTHPRPTPHPNPPPTKFPEPQLPSASLRRPQEYSGFFCPEHYNLCIFFGAWLPSVTQ